VLDAQWLTQHLTTLGAVRVSRAEYRRRLEDALRVDAAFG
jgi:leucyl/phenylalanyl-tRNA--protein transferase